MKAIVVLCSSFIISACSFNSSQDLKRAEKLLKNFQCHNIESNHMVHSAITNYHEKMLAESRHKAEDYVQHYQAGDILFNSPLSDVVEEQYSNYQNACQALGGIQPKQNQSAE